MKHLNPTIIIIILLCAAPFVATADTQPTDAIQTYIMPQPYPVHTITPPKGDTVKNVVLMIGDGMSLMHVYSAWTANHGKLFLENSQTVGLSKTYCADRLITDSGAAGTAMATGRKTNYHSVGVDTHGNPLPSIIDIAAAHNLSTGIIATCRLWDATPADFCCHNVDREDHQALIADYTESPVQFVFGGGAQLFRNRTDGRDILGELQAKGYATPTTLQQLDTIETGKVFAVPYPVDTPLPAERGDMLARVSTKALDILNQNPQGFFLMIEGSQLDDYGHQNNLKMLMEETHDFDRTVGTVMQWAANNGQTLVIVTADHETGGLTLIDGDINQGKIQCKFSTTGHSGAMVPVYAFGPAAQLFTGIYENTQIFTKILQALHL